jgi:hypothetical protein
MDLEIFAICLLGDQFHYFPLFSDIDDGMCECASRRTVFREPEKRIMIEDGVVKGNKGVRIEF